MDQKEREGKANLAPVRGFIPRVFRDMQQMPRVRNPGRGKLPIRVPNQPDRMDLQGVSERLRKLSPQQEKVIRLYFGLGCERPHSAREMAQEFGVSAQVIAAILGAAQRRLAREGLTSSDLREAARCESELRHSPRPLMESMSEFKRDRHWHRRF